MIQNLNPIEFQIFGSLLPENTKATHNDQSVALSMGSATTYQTVADTRLRSESGFTVLSVSSDGTNYRDFYLDRPLRLKAGLWFRLTAFQEKSSVVLSAVLMPRELTTAPAQNFAIGPQLQVTSLTTFFYQEPEQGFLFPGEARDMAKLTYVDNGTIHSVVDGQDSLLNQGDLVVYAPGQWHMQYADTGIAPRFLSISFTAAGCDWSTLSGRPLQASKAVRECLLQMVKEQESPAPHSSDMLLSLLNVILISLLRENAGEVAVPAAGSSENRIIARAQQYITDHVADKLSVPIVAKNIGVSASYLTALFQKHLQISPGEYLRRVKLQKSKQLIREGNLNFTQIAEALEYSTVHHFSRQFKEKFGITPSQYAKSVK
jgi:AraC-like DNA-binding protein